MRLTDIEKRELERYCSIYDFSSWIHGKTILITGAKGIVGSGLIKWLLFENERQDLRLKILASTRNPDEVPTFIEQKDPIRYCLFGKEDQEDSVNYIVHAASPTGKEMFMSKPVESLQVILDETNRILRIASENKCTMIYLSSEEVYGTPKVSMPIGEEYIGAIDSLNIRSCYPLGKKVAELLCRSYYAEYETDVRIIRPTVIQGLFQNKEFNKIENEILRCVLEKQNLLMKSLGKTKKSMIYSLDAIAAILTVLFKGKSGEAYNATNPETFMSVKDLASYIFKKFSPELSIEYLRQDIAGAEGYLPQRSLQQDIRKIEELGWKPLTGLDQIYQIDLERFTKKKYF